MKNFMKYAVALSLFFGVTAANAQEVDRKGHTFISVQGGVQTTFTNYDCTKLITPQYAISFGRYFNDMVGARLNVMGYQQKSAFPKGQYLIGEDTKYDFNACTADVDLLMNMTNILNPNRTCRAFDWVLLAGFGTNYAWGYEDFNTLIKSNKMVHTDFDPCSSKHSSFNGRLGTQFNYNVCDNFSVGLELQANYKNDLYNLKTNGNVDWQAVALLGVTYKFGKKKAKPAPVVEPEPTYETRIDTVWYDDVEYKTVPCEEKIERNIHFTIRKSSPVSEQMVREVSEFVKSHKDVKVSVCGYADKGTGNPRVNMKYSKQRAEGVTKALVEAGIPAEIITTEWKGDAVQPFAENDENRVAVTVATGMGEKKEKVTVKKFRLEEKKVRVN